MPAGAWSPFSLSPKPAGEWTPGDAIVADTSCGSAVPTGTTCAVTISYDPTTIMCTYSPYGYAYTGIDLALATDAGANKDFTQRFTVTGVRICDD
jgi:hypothetical protein